MKVTELAYIAGLFDGEGSIHVARLHGTSGKSYYRIVAQVDMTDDRAIRLIEKMGYGSIYVGKPKPPNRAGCFHWVTVNKQAAEFLLKILPYLRIKKEQAYVALQFQSERATSSWSYIGEDFDVSCKILITKLNDYRMIPC